MNKVLTRLIFSLTAVIALLGSSTAVAQQNLSEFDRNRYITEIREYKHKFLASELKLSKEQQTEFFPLYDQMEDRLMTIGDETRKLENSISEDTDLPAIQIESAAEAVYTQKLKEAQVENEYLPKFKAILQLKQLLRLRNAEKKFTQSLVRHHRRISRDRDGDDGRHNGRK